MTHAEIKAAFMDECPVMFNGVRYRRVSALIYERRRNSNPACNKAPEYAV